MTCERLDEYLIYLAVYSACQAEYIIRCYEDELNQKYESKGETAHYCIYSANLYECFNS